MSSGSKAIAMANAVLTPNEITFKVVNVFAVTANRADFPDVQFTRGDGNNVIAVY